jgi:hypothetical protein
MRKLLHPLVLAGVALFALAASLPFLTTAKSQRGFYFFEAELTSTAPGMAQLFFDVGRGSNEDDSSHAAIVAGTQPQLQRFPLEMGTCHSLRFDPLDRECVMTIAHARIVDRSGRVVRTFTSADFTAVQQIAALTAENGVLKVATTPGAFDPILTLKVATPIKLAPSWGLLFGLLLPVWIGLGALLLLVGWAAGGASGRLGRLATWAEAHPVRALFGTALVAVAVQCHPVIFFGKSFVSPNNAVYLLYDTFPTVPGYQSTDVEDARGADVGAMMWAHMYFPELTREALFRDGELPLWNRYDLTGTPLLGQGQTMIGDPLNWLTIAANSAAWAWDARFVLMRVLFAFGSGLAVWLLARQLGPALLVTGSSVFIGFFAFRLNHAAILSVCWSPWVLVAWCWLLEARTPRARNLSLLALVVAHAGLMNSGTIKEAYMLAACLDFAGLLLVLGAAEPLRRRLGKLAAAALAGVVFALLMAPQWIAFLDALRKSHTHYDVPAAAQLPPWMFVGFFEDLFYRQLRPQETHFEPSSNVVMLLGFLWALVGAREHFANRRFVAIFVAALLPFTLIFGIIPAAWIVKVPFVANIIHVDNTFSCSLIVLMSVLAGFGFATVFRQAREPGGLSRYLIFVTLLGVLAALYFGSTQQNPKSAFFQGYIPSLLLVLLFAPALAGLAFRRQQRGLVAAIFAGALVLLLWRHAQYVANPFDTYVLNPKVRVNLSARSPATRFVDAQLQRTHEPSRPVGLGYNLFPGYNQRLDWESIYGVDALRNPYVDELAELTPMKKLLDWVGGPPAQEDIGAALPMQDLLNVRYYLAGHQVPPRELAGRQPLGGFDLDVYESPTAWPRAFFTDTLTHYRTPAEFVGMTLAGDRRPFAAIQEQDVATQPDGLTRLPRNLGARTIRPASDYQLTSNTTSFTVAANTAGVIVLTESYYPGDFEVLLNGEPADYFRVNHAFKGVYVDHPGTYHVTFRYWPEHLTFGLWLAAGGLLLGVGAPLGEWWFQRRRAAPA